MATPLTSFDVPYTDSVVDSRGMLSTTWTSFLRTLFDRLNPLGAERSFQLVNNQSDPAAIEGMKVNCRAVSHAIVEYFVQRVTTGVGATELVEAGVFKLCYRPTLEDWVLGVVDEETPDDAGVTFTASTDGQINYQTSNITGTHSISRIVWRMRTLAGKSAQYSSQGTRA